eukprot:TRINITY_DN3715_c1_g1_i3.p1 TRINITY_DN3715_c1_g1~~TRINITY_DN3715_c1_g1_i3.p1  ORF type:complete len:633 (+),score=197.06 TRINITY_DN3715_c1_g1_i3:83-1981(+)
MPVSNMDASSERDAKESTQLFGKLYGELNLALDAIAKDFKAEEFDPLPHVVKILEPQSAESREQRQEEIDASFGSMDDATEKIIDVYYVGFNKSIKNYSTILSHVTTSQRNVHQLRKDLDKTKKYLSSRSKAVKAMWKQNLEFAEMIKILDKMEELRKVPKRLEELMTSHYYLNAARLLVNSRQELFAEELLDVGALAELRNDLTEKKSTFHEILIYELNDCLYNNSNDESELEDDLDIARTTNWNETLNEDLTKDPRSDRNLYIRFIVEALHTVERLPTLLSSLTTQLSIQLRTIIEDCITQVKTQREIKLKKPEEILRKKDQKKENDLVLLCQLVFPKCLLILKNHIYLSTLISKKYIKPDPKGDSKKFSANPYTIESVWKVMQAELEALIKIHLQGTFTEEGFLLNPIGASMKTIQNVGNFILENIPTIPMVEGSPAIPTKAPTKAKPKQLFSFAGSSAATFTRGVEKSNANSKHDIFGGNLPLVPSTPYNITPIFLQITDFDQKAAQMLPFSKDGIGLKRFVDEWIISNFIPHLQNDFTARVDSALDSSEAFKSRDRMKGVYSPLIAYRPLIQSAMDIYEFVEELFLDVVTMPTYSSAYLDIIETTLTKYIERCKLKLREVLEATETG